MNIIDYINKYGDKNFDEKRLNEVDKLIFAVLSYVDFSDIVSKDYHHKKKVSDVSKEFFKKYSHTEIRKNITAVRNGIKLLSIITDKKRYRDILMFNNCYIATAKEQFSAVCFQLEPKLIYVSFEGTDEQVSGWKEDFMMAYSFPVPAQNEAIRYLNNNFTFCNSRLIVGGHSKGGNLALVSSMYANLLVKSKIISIYSYDGPGLRPKQISSIKYKQIKSKYQHIIPNHAIVGLLYKHDFDYTVVKANKHGLMAHSALTWQVEDSDFIKVRLSKASMALEKSLDEWVNSYTKEQIEKFTNEIFDAFNRNGITDVVQIVQNYRNLFNMFKETAKMDKIVSLMLKDLIDIIIKSNKENNFE